MEDFNENPLRIYEIAKYTTKFEFEIDNNLYNDMKLAEEELKKVPVEKVFLEFKSALNSQKPSKFFEVLKKANLLYVHFEEINRLIDVEQPFKYHPEGDAFNHTMLVLDYMAKITDDERLRFAALVHDFGKGLTPKSQYPHHYCHNERGVTPVIDLSNRLKIPEEWTSYGKSAVFFHMKGEIFYKMTPKKQVDFIEGVAKTQIGLYGLEKVVEADRSGRGNKICEVIKFADLGTQMLNEINDNSAINSEKIYEERILWMKNKKI